MTLLITEIKDILVAANVGIFGDASATWPIYIGRMPADVKQGILMKVTGGRPPEPKWLIDYPTISVLVRGKSYEISYNKITEIKNVLHTLPAQDLTAFRLVSCVCSSEPVDVGYAEEDFITWSTNFDLIVEPNSSADDNRTDL